jgi:hypothetical protein
MTGSTPSLGLQLSPGRCRMEPHGRQAGRAIPACWNENRKGKLLLVPRLTGSTVVLVQSMIQKLK